MIAFVFQQRTIKMKKIYAIYSEQRNVITWLIIFTVFAQLLETKLDKTDEISLRKLN